MARPAFHGPNAVLEAPIQLPLPLCYPSHAHYSILEQEGTTVLERASVLSWVPASGAWCLHRPFLYRLLLPYRLSARAPPQRFHPASLPSSKHLERVSRMRCGPVGVLKSAPQDGPTGKYDPCVDDAVTLYMNRPEVQRALHANTTNLPHPWTTCTPYIQYSR